MALWLTVCGRNRRRNICVADFVDVWIIPLRKNHKQRHSLE
jgi:hypothetical protein